MEYSSTVAMTKKRTPAHDEAWRRMWLQSSGKLTSWATRRNLKAPAAKKATAPRKRRIQRSEARCRGSHSAQANRDAIGVSRTCNTQRPNKASPSSTRCTRSRSSDSSSLRVLRPQCIRLGGHLEDKIMWHVITVRTYGWKRTRTRNTASQLKCTVFIRILTISNEGTSVLFSNVTLRHSFCFQVRHPRCVEYKLIYIYIYIYIYISVEQWLRCCATNRKVAGLIPAGVIRIFHWHKILPIALWPWGRLSL